MSVNVLILSLVGAQVPAVPACLTANTLELQAACCSSFATRFACLSFPFCAFVAAHAQTPCPPCPGCPPCSVAQAPPGMPAGIPAEMPAEMMPAGMPAEMMPAGTPAEMMPAGMPTEMMPPEMPAGMPAEMMPAGTPAEMMPLALHRIRARVNVDRRLRRADPVRGRRSFLQLDARQAPVAPGEHGTCIAWTPHADTCGEWLDDASKLDAPGQIGQLMCPSEADKIVKPLPALFIGSATVFHKDSRQALPPAFRAVVGPVFVFAGTPTFHGKHPVASRVSGVDNTQFSMRIQEPGCFDGKHKRERVDYIAVAQAAVNNDHFIGGIQALTKGPDGWQAVVKLRSGFFHLPPVVLPQLQIANVHSIAPRGKKARARAKLQRELDFVTPRLSAVSNTEFTVYLQHGTRNTAYEPPLDEANNPAVLLAWIAFKQTDGDESLATTTGHHKFIAQRFDPADKTLASRNRGINHKWQTYRFKTIFANPLIFAYVQSAKGRDALTVRMRNPKRNSVRLLVQENKRKCKYDNRHAKEIIGLVVIDAAPK